MPPSVRPGQTRIGYSSPSEPVLTERSPVLEASAASSLVPAAIEVVMVRVAGLPKRNHGPWRSLEIWTKNRVYSMDEHGTCIEVLDRVAGRLDETHSLLGAQLAGGRRREGKTMKLSHPYPVPGTEAVFRLPPGRAGRFGHTSKVERVVMRVRYAEVDMPGSDDWDEITASAGIPGR